VAPPNTGFTTTGVMQQAHSGEIWIQTAFMNNKKKSAFILFDL
jgi:hypothetical protein